MMAVALALAVVTLLGAIPGCGDSGGSGSVGPAADRERARQLARDPHDLSCRDLQRQTTELRARTTHTAETAIARHPALRRHVARHMLARAVQSIHYANTEICKRTPREFRPAAEAVAGVRAGRYRAELCVGSGC